MEKIYSIVQELQAEAGKNNKKKILERETDNVEFKKFISAVLDTMKVYGIQDKKLNRFLGKTDGNTEHDDMFSVFSYLEKNNTGRDSDAEVVARFIDSQPDEYKEFLVESFCKKIRMGIDSTVNKAWGSGFLSEFKLMLAKDFYKESHKIKGATFVLTEKLDGMRLAIFVEDNGIKAFTRQGKAVTGLVELEEEFLQLPTGVYDGEVLIEDEHLYSDRQVLQETLKLARKDGDKEGLNFHIFDYLTLEEFEEGESKYDYNARRRHIEDGFKYSSVSEDGHIKLLPILYEGSNLEVIPELLKQLENEGKEGLMLNLSDKKYVSKRTNFIMKIKSMKTFDEVCTGVFEGEGKYKGMLGGITALYKGYPLKIGSGFNDEQRKLYWDNPELIVDSIVEVQYFRESSNADGGLSVSFPVFKGLRLDKTEPSYH